MPAFAAKEARPQQPVSPRPSKTVTTPASNRAQSIANLRWTFGHQVGLQLQRARPNGPVVGSEDSYEREADHVSEQVMRMPEPQLQRACACGGDCPRCDANPNLPGAMQVQPNPEDQPLQTKRVGPNKSAPTAAPPVVNEALAAPGRPLDPATRAFMEPRFGQDFSQVRVHSGPLAERSTRAVNALAYTVGSDIVLRERFVPGTHEGRRLIAHELTHVIQQTSASPQSPSAYRNPTGPMELDTIAPGVQPLPSPRLQRNDDTEPEDIWVHLSPDGQKEAAELYDQCTEWMTGLAHSQQASTSVLRTAWLNMFSNILFRIGNLTSDTQIPFLNNVFTDFTATVTGNLEKFLDEWDAVEARYLDEHRHLLGLKSTDATEAAKRIEELYTEAKGRLDRGAMDYITDEDYNLLKATLDSGSHIWLGVLRASRIRVKNLRDLMRVVEDLRQHGEDANKYVPEWSERVLEEAAHLNSMARRALEDAMPSYYEKELSELGSELLKRRETTLEAHARKKSWLENAGSLVYGVGAGVVGPFVEAAKEAVDLVQIAGHFVTLGRYQPEFVSDMAAAAEQGASTSDLLKGMVTGIIETPERFVKAIRDGDWEAIGREAVNLYFLAKTIKETPQMIKQLPKVVATVNRGLRILRTRVVALGLKNEVRLLPNPKVRPEVKAVQFVEQHPRVIQGEPGQRRAAVGEGHEIVEVIDESSPTGIGCEFHSPGGPVVPCPSGMGTRQAVKATIRSTETVGPGGTIEIQSEGRIGDAPAKRPGLEKKYPLPGKVGLPDHVRFHVEGIKAIGDELNVVYAPERFNISETAVIENQIRAWRNEVRVTGGELYFDIKAKVHVHSVFEGVTIKILDEITWKLERRLPGTDVFETIFEHTGRP